KVFSAEKRLQKLLEFKAEVNEKKTTRLHQSMSLRVLQESVKSGQRYATYKRGTKAERLKRLEEKHMAALCGVVVYSAAKRSGQESAEVVKPEEAEAAESAAEDSVAESAGDEAAAVKAEPAAAASEAADETAPADDGRRRSKKPRRFIDEEESGGERRKQPQQQQPVMAEEASRQQKKKAGKQKRRSTSEGAAGSGGASSAEKKQRRRKRKSDALPEAAAVKEEQLAGDEAAGKLETAAVAEPKRKAKMKIADSSVEEAEGGSIYCSVCGCAALLISLQGKIDICKTCYTAFTASLRSASQQSDLECDCGGCAKCRAVAVLKSGIDLSVYSVAKGFPSWVSRYGERPKPQADSAESGGKKAVKIKRPSVEAAQRMGSLYDSVSRGQLRQCVQAVTGDTGSVAVDVPQEMSNREEAWRDGVAVFGRKGSVPDISQPQCLLCGSGGAEQDLMLRCSCCTEQFHLYCLSVCERPLWSGLTPWRCARCLVCRVCKRSGTACRSCIKCGAAYHPDCLEESRGYSVKDWQLCCDCAACKHCGKVFSDDWSDWDNLCQHCESTEVTCHECHRVTSLIGNSLACSTPDCKNVVHATCAGINDELYHVYLVNEQLDFFCRDCDSRGFHALKAACVKDLRARIRALSESLGLPSRPQQLDGVLDDIDEARHEAAAEKIFCRMPPYQEFSSGHDLVKAIIIELIEACKIPDKLPDCALLSTALDKGVAALFSWLRLADLRAEVLDAAPRCPEPVDADALSCSMMKECRELSVRKLREATAVDGAGECELCGQRKQDSVLGRLLPSARTSWIHAGCALFSPEIRVDESDCIQGVRAAVRRARGNRCSECGKVGASIDCLSLSCPRVCHLGCALTSGWQFSDLCECRCSDCADIAEFAGCDLPPSDFGRLLCQRLVVGAADQSLCEVSLPPDEVTVRIGGLLITRLGCLRAESGSMGTVLLPVGFRAQRQFWSIREAGKISIYDWRLQAEAGKVRFVLASREESLRLCASHPVTVMRRLCQMVGECWTAQVNGRKPLLLAGNGWSSVGIVHPRVVWCVEQLGFCRGYSPKYLIHRWAQLRKQESSPNASGCARSEPFKAASRPEAAAGNSQLKRTFSFLLSSARRPVTTVEQQCSEEAAVVTVRNQIRVARSEHWQCRVQVLPSSIHGLGLFAVRPFAKAEFIVEYTGELIRASLSEAKEKFYQSRNIDCYLFKVNWQWVIDASMKGGPARFINHSCSPNCVTRVMDQRILIVAGRDIAAGEELTYDYRFDKEEDKVACHCGSVSCRKFLN
uniref:Histone-lysine N-methyltransferase n=1 Tax=Macrostomum lignano TaxID=282301 RepID=A0A1I8I1L9_9PLAT